MSFTLKTLCHSPSPGRHVETEESRYYKKVNVNSHIFSKFSGATYAYIPPVTI